MFDHLQKQLSKIQDLDGFQIEASFDPFDNASIEQGISDAIAKLEQWANCGHKDDVLRKALDAYSDQLRASVYERAEELRSEERDMREFPIGDLGKQLRSLEKRIRSLASVEYDEAQDRAVRIGKTLKAAALEPYVSELIDQVDFDDFLKRSQNSGGSMIGSSSYQWPDDDDAKLGTMLALVLYFSENPNEILEHGLDMFGATNYNRGIQKIYRNVYVPMNEDLTDYIKDRLNMPVETTLTEVQNQSKRIFVVHGHDIGMREGTARFLERLGLEAVILHEQTNSGTTIIEKLEANSDVGFAVVLMSADDEGQKIGSDSLEPRPRQNVVLETGWFMGRFGRDRTVVLLEDGMSLPSDLAGLAYTRYDSQGAWRQELVRELRGAGYDVSL